MWFMPANGVNLLGSKREFQPIILHDTFTEGMCILHTCKVALTLFGTFGAPIYLDDIGI